MTAQERCDAIAKALYMGEIPDLWKMMAEVIVRSQIEEADRESYIKGVQDCQKNENAELRDSFIEGFSAAKEKAKNLVYQGCVDGDECTRRVACQCCKAAARIGQMKPEGK